jgi:hypothetical protein
MKKLLIVIIIYIAILSALVFLFNRGKVLTEEEVVSDFLTVVFTNTEKDLELYHSDDYEKYTTIYDSRIKKVRPLLTQNALEASMRTRSLSLISGSQLDVLTEIENIQFDFRETSKPDELVCYYLFDLIYEEDDRSKTITTGGNLLLLKEGETWRIETFHHSFRDLMKKIYN